MEIREVEVGNPHSPCCNAQVFYSDDTGEWEQKLSKEIQEKNKRIAENENLVAELKAQLESRDKKLDKVKIELDIHKSTLSAQVQDALRQASESFATQNRDLLRNEVQSMHSRLESEFSRRNERDKLRERVDDLERLVTEVSISPCF
ncbi:hypothetical protein FRC12_006486 [Ceratobasidium sp. 428]|nr:hypothetical protein FRC12_006486 [Ceratobasidium sp. 428]